MKTAGIEKTKLMLVVFLLGWFATNVFSETTNSPTASELQAVSTNSSSVSDPHKVRENLNTAFNGMTAIGTLLVSALAVFGQRIRSWIIRPKLSLRAGKDCPLVEQLHDEDSSTTGGKKYYQELRLEVKNTGKEAARNCKILCSSVFKQRPGSNDYYAHKEFVPRSLYWASKKQTTDLLPQLPEYLVVARIKEEEVSTSSNPTGPERQQSYGVQVTVEAEGVTGRFIFLDKGKFLLPLLVYADNLREFEHRYLELFWDGTKPSDLTDEHFNIKLLSKNEGEKLLGRQP